MFFNLLSRRKPLKIKNPKTHLKLPCIHNEALLIAEILRSKYILRETIEDNKLQLSGQRMRQI